MMQNKRHSRGGMWQMFKSSLEKCPDERSTRGGSKQAGQVSRSMLRSPEP